MGKDHLPTPYTPQVETCRRAFFPREEHGPFRRVEPRCLAALVDALSHALSLVAPEKLQGNFITLCINRCGRRCGRALKPTINHSRGAKLVRVLFECVYPATTIEFSEAIAKPVSVSPCKARISLAARFGLDPRISTEHRVLNFKPAV